jgi:hypothetical protein
VTYEPIPYAFEQGIFEALQGIKSGDQGNFSPHRGTRSRPLFWHLPLPRRRRGRPPDDLALEAGFLSMRKAGQAFPEIGRQVRRREQTAFRASRWRRRFCRSPPGLPELPRSCGTEPPLDMLMTLQGVYTRNRSVRCGRALGERHGGCASGNWRARSIGA